MAEGVLKQMQVSQQIVETDAVALITASVATSARSPSPLPMAG